jgi:hypothetical protein
LPEERHEQQTQDQRHRPVVGLASPCTRGNIVSDPIEIGDKIRLEVAALWRECAVVVNGVPVNCVTYLQQRQDWAPLVMAKEQ